jgi:hypothetical protein
MALSTADSDKSDPSVATRMFWNILYLLEA